MAARVLSLSQGIAAAHNTLMMGTRDDRTKGKELGQLILNNEEIRALQEIVELLRPAAGFTHWAGGNTNPTISQLYHRIYPMLPSLETFTTMEAIGLYRTLDTEIKAAWPLADIPDYILLAIYLNPACAMLDMMDIVLWQSEGKDVTVRGKAQALLVKELTELYLKNEERLEKEQEAARRQDPQQEISFARKSSSSDYLEVLELRAKMVVAGYQCEVKHHKTEWARYIDVPQEYWKLSQKNMHIRDLEPIARVYLCMQATSSESERLFSKAGRVLSARKSRLNDSTFRDIVFASSFEKHFLQHGK